MGSKSLVEVVDMEKSLGRGRMEMKWEAEEGILGKEDRDLEEVRVKS